MTIIFFILSVVGLALLILCICKLAAPFTGWRYEYKASVGQAIMDIPKAGRYDVCIRRDRSWLIKRQGSFSDNFPSADFIVTQVNTKSSITYRKRINLVTRSKGISTITMPIGFFNAPVSGKYSISDLNAYQFLQEDEIIIRKHLSAFKFVLLVIGICGSSMVFIGGLVFALIK